MKFRIITPLLVLSLSGCIANYNSHVLNNNFMEIDPESPHEELVGVWTGPSGPWMGTFVIRGDGTGEMCSSWGAKNSHSLIKISGETLFLQEGTRVTLVEVTGTTLKYRGYGQTVMLHRDDKLTAAAPYCREALKDVER